jgi:hypothetical protein
MSFMLLNTLCVGAGRRSAGFRGPLLGLRRSRALSRFKAFGINPNDKLFALGKAEAMLLLALCIHRFKHSLLSWLLGLHGTLQSLPPVRRVYHKHVSAAGRNRSLLSLPNEGKFWLRYAAAQSPRVCSQVSGFQQAAKYF